MVDSVSLARQNANTNYPLEDVNFANAQPSTAVNQTSDSAATAQLISTNSNADPALTKLALASKATTDQKIKDAELAQLIKTNGLKPLDDKSGGYAGVLKRPFDPSGKIPGTIGIGYNYYPSTGTRDEFKGTIVLVQGGPGYSSTGSKDAFLELVGKLKKDHNVLIIDNRGTGKSEALGAAYTREQRVGKTAEQLAAKDAEVKASKQLQYSGAFNAGDVKNAAESMKIAVTTTDKITGKTKTEMVSTTNLYGTRVAAEDMSAVINQVVGKGQKVDMYGASYGTFFAQVFTRLHPEQVKSVVLDSSIGPLGSAAQGVGKNEVTSSQVKDVMEIYNEVNKDQKPAGAEVKETAEDRLKGLLTSVRATGEGTTIKDITNSNGKTVDVKINAQNIFRVFTHGGGGTSVWRDLDAATIAYQKGDKVPLARLIAESQIVGDGTDESSKPEYYSKLAFVVVSQDYPKAYSEITPPGKARSDAVEAAIKDETEKENPYFPFTVNEALRGSAQEGNPHVNDNIPLAPLSPETASIQSSLSPLSNYSPLPDYPKNIPTLILLAERDPITTKTDAIDTGNQVLNIKDNKEEADKTKTQQIQDINTINPAYVKIIKVPGATHEAALNDPTKIAADTVRTFWESPDVKGNNGKSDKIYKFPSDDTVEKNFSNIQPINTVKQFATSSVFMPAATQLNGSKDNSNELRIASTVVATVGDVVARADVNTRKINEETQTPSAGLRGGSTQYDKNEKDLTFTMTKVKWAENISVSGKGVVDGSSKIATAKDLVVMDAKGHKIGTVTVTWNTLNGKDGVRITGKINDVSIDATTPAP